MIFSHKLKMLFIKGRKVGGSSIEFALTPYCGPDDIVTPLDPIEDIARFQKSGQLPRNFGEPEYEMAYLAAVKRGNPEEVTQVRVKPAYWNHMPVRALERALGGPVPSDYTIVCAQRRPYEKVVSLARWQLAFASYNRGEAARFSAQDLREQVARIFEKKLYTKLLDVRRCTAKNGRFPSKILKFESLERDFAEMLKAIEVEFVPPFPHLKDTSSTGSGGINLLKIKQIERINRIFADEFGAFGYERID